MAETLTVTTPGLTWIQDLGRRRAAAVGQLTGGALDQYSAEVATALVGSARTAPLLELVAMDFGDVPAKTVRRIPLTSWFRFQRAVENTPTVLLVITPISCAQTCAALGLKTQPGDFSAYRQADPAHSQLLQEVRSRAELLRFLDLLTAASESLVIRKTPNLMIRGHGLAPVRDGAFRIPHRGLGKGLLRFRVLERVQEGKALFECGLHLQGATCREIHFAKLAGWGGLVRQSIRPKSPGEA